jgi:hypothetical protein
MRNRFALVCMLLSGTGLSAGDNPVSSEKLASRAATIRPTKEEMRWQQIPWLGSLVEARRQAQQEKRPIVIWTLDEDPFERC